MQCLINHHFIHKDKIDDLRVEEMFKKKKKKKKKNVKSRHNY